MTFLILLTLHISSKRSSHTLQQKVLMERRYYTKRFFNILYFSSPFESECVCFNIKHFHLLPNRTVPYGVYVLFMFRHLSFFLRLQTRKLDFNKLFFFLSHFCLFYSFTAELIRASYIKGFDLYMCFVQHLLV